MKIRLVLLPEAKISKIAKDLSREISGKYNTYFKLDSQHIPHVTITTIVFDDKYLTEIIKNAKELIQDVTPFSMIPKEIVHDGTGSISIHFQKSENFKTIYTDAMNMYGNKYPVKKMAIEPHLSLTKLKNENNVKKCLQDITDFKNDFLIKYLAICEDGDFGTCTKIIKRYKLGEGGDKK